MKNIFILISLFLVSSFAEAATPKTLLKCQSQNHVSKSAFRLVKTKGKLFGIYGRKYQNSKTNYIRFSCAPGRNARPAGSTAPKTLYTCRELPHKNHLANGPIYSVQVTQGGLEGFPFAQIYSELPMPAGYSKVDALVCQVYK